MIKRLSSSFVVLPRDCNGNRVGDNLMIFGGSFMSQLDLCMASVCREILSDSPTGCADAITHKFSATFHKAAVSGDLVFMDAEVVELRERAIVIKVEAYRKVNKVKEPLASAEGVFISRKEGIITQHGLNVNTRVHDGHLVVMKNYRGDDDPYEATKEVYDKEVYMKYTYYEDDVGFYWGTDTQISDLHIDRTDAWEELKKPEWATHIIKVW